MALHTATRTRTQAPSASPHQPAVRHGLLHPAGMDDLHKRDLYREFLRWPTVLVLPISVAILTVIGMNSVVAAVPCAPLLATVATLIAVRQACSRMTSRSATAGLLGLVPKPRPADPR